MIDLCRLVTRLPFVTLFVTIAACGMGEDSRGPELGRVEQHAAAMTLVIVGEPTVTVAGQTISPVIVEARDDEDLVDTTYNGDVTLALGNNPGGLGVLDGTLTVPAINGVATFDDLSIERAAQLYTITASSGSLVGDTSTAFDITAGAATTLEFAQEPADVVEDQIMAPLTVRAVDDFGNLDSTYNANVTMAIGNNPGGSVLSGGGATPAVAGIATFANLSLNNDGDNYTLTASSGSLVGDVTLAFNVLDDPADHLVFSVQPPGSAQAGATFGIEVRALNSSNQVDDEFTGQITLAIGTNPNSGTLSGTNPVAAVAGVATFGNVAIDRAGNGYTLTAGAAGVTGDTSNAFNILAGSATQLVITVEPSNVGAGAPISPSVVVQARDALGNLDTTFTAQVTATKNTGPALGSLTGTTGVNASGGVATFSDLRIDRVGSYTLAFDASGLTGDTSAAFDVTPGNAATLAFVQQPTSQTAGEALTPAPTVEILDAFGNRVTGFVGSVTMTKASGPSTGTLSGDTVEPVVNGVATFDTIELDKNGTYTLLATSGTMTVESSAFDINPAAASKLVYNVQPPSSGTAGAGFAVTVHALDPHDNLAVTFAGQVSLAIQTNPGGGALSGTTPVAAIAGIATFTGLSIDRSGNGYVLRADASGLTPADSNPFDIVAAAAHHLSFQVQPSTTVAGVAINPAVVVHARDAFENISTTFTSNITIALDANPGASTLGGTATVAASGGVASFNNLTLDKVGTGYTLAASTTAIGVTAATSSPFDITPAAANHLVFQVQPSTTVAGAAITPAVVVRALDPFDNLDTNFALGITIAIGTNPGGSTLGGTVTRTASGGAATFNDLTLDKVGTGYTLVASRPGLIGATSAAFAITPAAATHLGFAVQPSTVTAGVAITPAVIVHALDAFENVDPDYATAITIALETNPGGSTLSGAGTSTQMAGVAIFGNLSLDKAASGYVLRATSGGLTAVNSNPFTVTPAAASVLVYTQNPTSVVAGFSISPSVVVQARDAFDNLATSYTLPITLAIGNNPGGSTLGGVFNLNAVGGVATFPAVILDKVGNGYTLVASGTSVTSVTSLPFDVTPGAATKLVFTVQPTDQLAGAVLTPPIEVRARDQFDNLATGYSGQVTISINNNPGGSNLLGTAQRNASGGIVSFDDLSLNRVGDGYTLSVTASQLTPAISAPFNIVSGTANRLFFTVQPTSTASGAAISPPVQISVRDSLGNLATGFTGNITIAIFANPGGSTLGGTTTVAAVGGVASFSTLTLDKVGSGYTLIATGSGLSSAISTTFNVTPATAATLHFTVQPGDVVAGVAHTPSIQVSARDAAGNLSTSFMGDVTLAIANNPGGSTLGGTLTRTAAAGIATFSGITLDKVGLDYTLSASAMGLPSATSGPFDVSPASATKLGFTVQPASTAAGDPITPAVRVTAFDPFDNVSTPYTGSVTVAIGANPGGSVLSGTTVVGSVLGVATFSTLSLDRAEMGYTLTASAAGLTGTTSTTFEITPSNASRLVFTVQPTSSVAGVAIAPEVRVEARDPSGNLDLTFNGVVTMSIGNNPGAATLMGTPMATASAGVAIFSDLSLDKVGTGYTLVGAAGGLVSATSAAFDITPAAASQLFFAQQPLDAVAGSFLAPPVRVEARDAFDNVDTSFTGQITVAIGANPGTSSLSGTAVVAAVAGVATYPDLSLDHVGTGYTLTASASGMTAVTSAMFAITPAAATRLGFFVQPGDTPAGQFITPAVVVEALDPFGNRATSYSGAITIELGANPGPSTLSGTLSGPAINGARAFNDLLLDRTAMGYTLTATATGLGSATSALFDVTPGAATSLVFAVQPSDAVAGAAIAPAIRVEVHDSSGNVVPTFSGNITLSIGTNPGGATLAGTAMQAATAGVALFDDISLDRQGSNYTLNATASGVSSVVSMPFSITPAAASRLVVSQQPTQTVAGLPITPAVQIAVEDAFGNRVPTFTGNIAIAIQTNPGGGSLGGTTTVAASNGVSSFTTLTIDRAAVGYTLRATSSGLTMVDTVAFDVISGVASALAFGVQPGDVVAGVAFSPAMTVTVRDTQGNLDPTFNGNITLAISNNPGSATLAGTISVLVTAGTATFDNVSLDKVGVDYTLAASAAGVPSATSSAFDVFPAAAATYVQTGLAANVPAATAQAVVFTAHDAFGNVATGYAGTANLTSTDADLEAPATVAFTDGVSASTSLEFHTGGVQMVTLTDQTTASVTATFDTNVTAIDMPTVRITEPSDGEEVGGNQVPITAAGTVAANATVMSVEILVDGRVIDTSDQLPFSTTWDASGLAIGSAHAITARVTDSEGNVVTSDDVTVTIMANEDGCCSAGGDPTGPLTLAGIVLLGVLLRRRRGTRSA